MALPPDQPATAERHDVPPPERPAAPRPTDGIEVVGHGDVVDLHLPPATLAAWLAHTEELPEDAAAAIAESLTPADGAGDALLVTGPSPIAGRGLFVREPVDPGTVLTVCPLLVIPGRLMEAFTDTTVYGHCFDLDDDLYGYPMGLATLLNHSAHPNAHCELDAEAAELWVHADRALAAGEEVTIDYTGGDADHELWFDLDG